MRYAIKLFYIGLNYHGFQRQPDLSTIEGELLRVLKKLKIVEDLRKARYVSASRTDREVSAVSQVVSFSSAQTPIIPLINSLLPKDIKTWAISEVPEKFNPRKEAIYKHYRYIIPYDGENLDEMIKGASLLEGTHDFQKLSKPNKKDNTICTLLEVKLQKQGDFVVFDFKGKRFLWKMIRKIVTTLLHIGKGIMPLEELRTLLNPSSSPTKDVQPASSRGLILYNIEYPFSFAINRIALEEIREYLRQVARDYQIRMRVHQTFLSAFSSLRMEE